MSGFSKIKDAEVFVFIGDPNCDAAHNALLKGLQTLKVPFIDSSKTITVSQRGNLGEYISLHVARAGPFSAMEKFAQNALQPLSGISAAGLDLTYVYFDQKSEENDLLYIQEVKTTGADNLNYLSNLVPDYEKLFLTDMNLTLQTRVQNIANAFEIERNNDEHAARVLRLGAKTPNECSKVRLIPTGVYDLVAGSPVQKMLAVRTAITAFGWNAGAISPWAIGLDDLNSRLLRIARGQS